MLACITRNTYNMVQHAGRVYGLAWSGVFQWENPSQVGLQWVCHARLSHSGGTWVAVSTMGLPRGSWKAPSGQTHAGRSAVGLPCEVKPQWGNLGGGSHRGAAPWVRKKSRWADPLGFTLPRNPTEVIPQWVYAERRAHGGENQWGAKIPGGAPHAGFSHGRRPHAVVSRRRSPTTQQVPCP